MRKRGAEPLLDDRADLVATSARNRAGLVALRELGSTLVGSGRGIRRVAGHVVEQLARLDIAVTDMARGCSFA